MLCGTLSAQDCRLSSASANTLALCLAEHGCVLQHVGKNEESVMPCILALTSPKKNKKPATDALKARVGERGKPDLASSDVDCLQM